MCNETELKFFLANFIFGIRLVWIVMIFKPKLIYIVRSRIKEIHRHNIIK